MAPKNTPEFAARIKEAVAASGLTQAQIAQRGGPSDTTLRKIMEGESVGISAVTMKKLDDGLGWTPGSAVRVYQGGEPEIDNLEYQKRVRQSTSVRDQVHGLYDQMERRGGLGPQRGDGNEPDVLDLLMDILGDLPDGAARDKTQRLYDEMAIRDFDQLFSRLSRDGKVQVVRFAGRILLLEENGTPIKSFFTGEPDDHVVYPTPDEFERNRHDISTTPATEGSPGEAGPEKKTRAADGRENVDNREDLINEDQADRADDYELVGRDVGGPSEQELIRRKQDQIGEDGGA